tara:strand:- start:11658 stop:12818 length:1161 start_codon:yes stop_codon:yes gene_type:complete
MHVEDQNLEGLSDEFLDEEDIQDDDEEDLEEFKADHSGGGTVKGAEVAEPASKNAVDPKGGAKGTAGAESKSSGGNKDGKKATMPKTKAGMINAALDLMKGKKKAELESMFDGIVDALAEKDETDDDEESVEEAKAPVEAKVTKEDIDLEADVTALFEGEELSDEFKAKATMIFEAAVVSKINEKLAEVTAETDIELDFSKESILEEVAEKVDGYLEYVVEQWMTDNELAVEAGIRNELTEDFIRGLKSLFEDHYIEVPEDRVDVLEELGNRNAELEEKLNKAIEDTILLRSQLSESKADEILADVTDGLADTQVEKVRSLSEGVTFEGEDDYREKLDTIVENYFPSNGKVAQEDDVDTDLDGEEEKVIPSNMQGYMNAISRTTVK